jgi:hypothetical protein
MDQQASIIHSPSAESPYEYGYQTYQPEQIKRVGIGNRDNALKSFSIPAPPTGKPVPSITIKAQQNSSPYKKPLSTPTTSSNRLQQSGPIISHNSDEIQCLKPSNSTEQLNQEMANLEGLMKDLSAITASEFEC